MPINIFSPQSFWSEFSIDEVSAEVLSEKKVREIIHTKLIINGKKTESGQVRISAYMAKQCDTPVKSAVILTNKSELSFDDKVVLDLAKNGFIVLAVDLTGRCEGKEECTVYPEDVGYANYEVARQDIISATGDIYKSCWYEWGVSFRYVVEYLKSIGIEKIGAVGVGNSATPVWHAIATTEDVSCAVIVGNAGWRVYKNIDKFSDEVDPTFTDGELQVLAGIEPQSYAKSVKCPVLMLAGTNSFLYDSDRAFDTVERISDDIYKAINYSANFIEGVDYQSYVDMKIFLREHLLEKKPTYLPSSPEIKADIVEGKITVEVTPCEKKGKNPVKPVALYLYASEGVQKSYLRCWKKLEGENIKNKWIFNYLPFAKSKIATFFAKCEYENGYTVSSKIIAKKFGEEEVFTSLKSSIMYSGREENSESAFSGVSGCTFDLENKAKVVVKNGPMDICGIRAESGLITFKVNAERDKPKEDAILMFDLFAKQDLEFTVSIFVDYMNQTKEYSTKFSVVGGKVWHNVRLDKLKFKTAEGKILKNYENVNAVKFYGEGVYLINNVLWV